MERLTAQSAFLPCIALAAIMLYPGTAAALCSMPVSPYCVEKRAVAERKEALSDSCLRRVENHLDRLRSYRSCLESQMEKTEREIDEYESLLTGSAAVHEDAGT